MRRGESEVELAASDLSRFLGCRHRTGLDLAVVSGLREAPNRVDPTLNLLRQRGIQHEKSYVEQLRNAAGDLVDLSELSTEEAVERSTDAMRSGASAIVQGALREGRWLGKPDVLLRREIPSALGSWSYEVEDTKLSRETKGATVLQLSSYSELLRAAQGVVPERFVVVTPDRAEPFRVLDYAAYFRLVRSQLEASVRQPPDAIMAANYPEPVEDCDFCRWWSKCNGRRRGDDHLSFVAGISRLQIRELREAGITTLAALGSLPLPLLFRPRRGSIETYVRVRDQARVQLAGRTSGRPVHEVFPIGLEHGFHLLPEPCPGDMFLDLEGDPFAGPGGREYLFGFAARGQGDAPIYRSHWAFTEAEEKAAFESTIDAILDAWSRDPGMHVYHYAAYEPSALKRLMGRHGIRDADIDRMLRGGLFVDLYSVVRRSLRAGVESYSIKKLEVFCGFERTVDLKDAGQNQREIEAALELGYADAITPEVKAAVEGYNRDDCLSAWKLRDWLEALRADLVRSGVPLPRPAADAAEPSERVGEREQRERELADRLLAGFPSDVDSRSPEHQASWLLAHLLGWHRRESKVKWWEYYRLCGLTEEDLLEEKDAIAGLEFVGRIGGTTANPVDRYRYPFQETDVREGKDLRLQDESIIGTVAAIDRVARLLDILKAKKRKDVHPTAVFALEVIRTDVPADAIAGIAEGVIERGIGSDQGTYRAARELLLARPPRVRDGQFEQHAGETTTDFAVRIASSLDQSVLAIQGPPGSGKTYTGAAIIAALVSKGRRVGVTALSHKVISNLLREVLAMGGKAWPRLHCAHKDDGRACDGTDIEPLDDNAEALSLVHASSDNVIGGTAHLWARPEFQGSLDVLVVDEAGQMPLANVLAVSPAAGSMVLLGDPRQLEQPQQGSHPDGTGVSSLEHMLAGHKTMSPERGIFLSQTRRLAPEICSFTSEIFYEGLLEPMPGLENQKLTGAPPFEGAGLWLTTVEHDGNQSSSPEEVEVVDRVVKLLLRPGSRWRDREGLISTLEAKDILVVAPYNAQVALLEERLGSQGIKAGTVDRFQGQEAPVVIYSLTTSTPEDAPRGMEFLFSLNRLNVATSRARCACILAASTRLFEPKCRTPRQMQLANALCRYRELARLVPV